MMCQIVINTSIQNKTDLTSIKLTTMHNYYEKYENKLEFWKDVFLFGLYILTILFSLFGNSIVCYMAFVLRPKSVTYLLIGNMAVGDLISAIVIPMQWLFCSTYMLDFNVHFCNVVKTLQVVSYFLSTFTMALIAVDRFMILHNPLASRIQPSWSITIIWLTSIILCIPTQFSMRVPEYFTANRLVHCRIILKSDRISVAYIRKLRISSIILCQYLVPFMVASIFYGLCIMKILSRQHLGESTNKQQLKFYQSKIRTIKMMLISLFAFIIGWFPIHFQHVMDFYLAPIVDKPCNASFLYNFLYWLAISSCCYNPFIYCWFDRKFRSTAQMFCCCCFCGWRLDQSLAQTGKGTNKNNIDLSTTLQ